MTEYEKLGHHHLRGSDGCEGQWEFLNALESCLCKGGQAAWKPSDCPCWECYKATRDALR